MQHLDPDRLVILALGESTEDAAESDHLAGCTDCRTEIDAMRHVAALSAETQDLRELPPPPDRVWQAITAAVAAPPPAQAAPSLTAVPTPERVRGTDTARRRRREVAQVLRLGTQLGDVPHRVDLGAAVRAPGEVVGLGSVHGILTERENDQPIGIQMLHRPPPIVVVAAPCPGGCDS